MKIIKLEDGKKYGWSDEPALYYGINLGLRNSLYAFSMYVWVDGKQHRSNSEHHYKPFNNFRYNIDDSFGGEYSEDY